jgi:hypothetical protein
MEDALAVGAVDDGFAFGAAGGKADGHKKHEKTQKRAGIIFVGFGVFCGH